MTFIADERFQAYFKEESKQWVLQIKYVQPRDVGLYECQVSTEPKVSARANLHVVGECANNKPFNYIREQYFVLKTCAAFSHSLSLCVSLPLQCHEPNSSVTPTDMWKLAAQFICSASFMVLLNHPRTLCGIMTHNQSMLITNSATKCTWSSQMCYEITMMPSNMSSTIWFNHHTMIHFNDRIR